MYFLNDAGPEAVATAETPAPAQFELGGLLAQTVRLTTPMLAIRQQVAIIEPGGAPVVLAGRGSRLGALLSSALQEIAACTLRGGTVSCQVLRHAIVMRGDNPIIMPESGLSLDWIMLLRAKALNVEPLFHWEQGRGPVLSLILPAVRAPTDPKRVLVKMRRIGAAIRI